MDIFVGPEESGAAVDAEIERFSWEAIGRSEFRHYMRVEIEWVTRGVASQV